MKLTKKTVSVALLAVFGITACSSGGKDGGPSTPTASQQSQTLPSSQPVQSNPTPASSPNTGLEELTLNSGAKLARDSFRQGELKNVDIGYGTLTGYNRRYSFNGVWGDWNNAPDQLNVEGRLIDLAKNQLTSYIGGLYGKALDSALNVLRHQENRKEVFYFGDETPVQNIPEKGSAVYRGNATRFDNIGSSEAKLANVGSSTLYADFTNKTISGTLDMNGLRRDITLHTAKIEGNSFKGNAVAERNLTNWIERRGTYEGKFFGPNADEVAGKAEFTGETLIGSVSDLNTSFSAEKVSSRTE